MGVLNLTALPSIQQEYLMDLVKQTDVFLVNGGDALYLAYWMK
jgi:dipeptidase E